MTAVTLAPPKLYTARDLERLSDKGYRYELIKGELREMSPTGAPHGKASNRIAFYASGHIYGNDLGEGFAAETGFVTEADPDNVLAPDFAFVAQDRLPDPLPDGFLAVVPDLVVETRSPSDTKRKAIEKAEEWLEAGVRLVWEINPKTRVLTVYRAGRLPLALNPDDILDGEDVLPGFTLPLTLIFPPRRN